MCLFQSSAGELEAISQGAGNNKQKTKNIRHEIHTEKIKRTEFARGDGFDGDFLFDDGVGGGDFQ